jgi:hypothetical protein
VIFACEGIFLLTGSKPGFLFFVRTVPSCGPYSAEVVTGLWQSNIIGRGGNGGSELGHFGSEPGERFSSELGTRQFRNR